MLADKGIQQGDFMNSICSGQAAIARLLTLVLALGILPLLPRAASADTVPYNQQTAGPPYTVYPHFSVPPENTIQAEYSILLTLYKQFYGAITAQCGYPLTIFPKPLANGAVAAVQYTSPCSGGNYIFGKLGKGGCPDGYTPDPPEPYTTCSRPDVAITTGESVIRLPDIVNGHVMTTSDITLTVTKNGQPDPGVNVFLQSDRGSEDLVIVPITADANGLIAGDVYTHDQPGGSTITTVGNDVNLLSPGEIDWLPARYEELFDITCYVLSLESDFQKTPLGTAPGVNGEQFHQGFIDDVRLQGTGLSLDQQYLHYAGHGMYSIITCPQTKSGACADDGTTVAVDRNVVPALSIIDIDSIGERVAQDTGGGINWYHIDVYYGTRRAECLQWGHRSRSVKLVDYGN